MAATQKSAVKPASAPRWPQGLVPWRKSVERFLEKVAKASGLQIEILGARRTQTGPDGTTSFELESASAGGFEGNWNPTRGADDEELLITGGSVFPGASESTLIVSDGTLAVHATSLNYVYLRLTLNPETVDSFVTYGSVSSPTLYTSTTAQVNSNTTAYILLCTWQEGTLVQRYKWFSFVCEITNGGSPGDVSFSAYP